MNLLHKTAHELAGIVKEGRISALEVTEASLDRIEEVEGEIGAFLEVNEEALTQAEEIDAKRSQGHELGPLAGVPVALKDNLCTAGVKTTCASKILKDHIPVYDATVVERLKAADAVMVGKTNLDEFAMGSSTENSRFHATSNPLHLSKVPGGSSGGSAAAVAAREAVVALGSDTGGSVRQPASFCGVVGLKPTYGRVSRYGLIAFASSLDQIGPITKDVEDAALLMNIISGHDPNDTTSVERPVPDFRPEEEEYSLAGLRIGLPEEYFSEGIDSEVTERVKDAVDMLREAGAEVGECSLPHTEYALPAYYIIAPAEASSNLARYDGVRYGYRAAGAADLEEMYEQTRGEGFGPEVRRRIMLGTYALSAGYYDEYYLQALKVRTLIKRDFEKAFADFDVLATPTTPTAPFDLGDRTDDPLSMYLADLCTIPANLAGIPALSVPCGFPDGLPVGLQLLGQPFQEGLLLRVGRVYEERARLEAPEAVV